VGSDDADFGVCCGDGGDIEFRGFGFLGGVDDCRGRLDGLEGRFIGRPDGIIVGGYRDGVSSFRRKLVPREGYCTGNDFDFSDRG
jgi:hypothetical protein